MPPVMTFLTDLINHLLVEVTVRNNRQIASPYNLVRLLSVKYPQNQPPFPA